MTTAATTAAPDAPTPPSERGAVRLENVTKRYGDQTAVDNLSLDIRPGEFLSLLGPSGCGKTTTLRMIAGFEQPDEGDILVSGSSVVSLPPYRRDVNTVFQAYALFPHLSIAQNVAYGLQQRKTPKNEIRERVSAALDMVQMRRYADRKPTQLSGGQQQRIALARALVNRPTVLLLDEPLGALDRQLREEMQVELKLLQAHLGITFVFVTHDQGEALSMSDRIAIMRSGRIEQLGDADAIYASPASAYVAAFVGQQNFFRGTASSDGSAVDTPVGVVASSASRVASGSETDAAVRPEFVRIAAAATATASGTNSVRGTLLSNAHLGGSRQFVVQLDDDHTVIVNSPSADAPALELGDQVVCWWDAAHVLLFPASTDAAGRAATMRAPATLA